MGHGKTDEINGAAIGGSDGYEKPRGEEQQRACAADIDSSNSAVMADLFEAASEIAKKLSLDSFRLVNNCGEKAGQSVMHLNFHMLSGRDFTWPPG